MEIKNVAVIGAGTMGNGIAHVLSLKDVKVELVDIKEEIVRKGIENISKNMDRQIKKEIITSEEKQLLRTQLLTLSKKITSFRKTLI